MTTTDYSNNYMNITYNWESANQCLQFGIHLISIL